MQCSAGDIEVPREFLLIVFSVISNHREELALTFVLISWGGVRLSPLGTSATNWLLYQPRMIDDDDDDDDGDGCGAVERELAGETEVLGENGHRCGKSATNRLYPCI
jgi:hypothetical protein